MLIRYIIRILIFPLANPIIKSFFTAFYLDDYIKMLDARIKNYYNAIIIGNEETDLNQTQIETIKQKLERYVKILTQFNSLVEKLNLKIMKKQITEKIQKIINMFVRLIDCYTQKINILNRSKDDYDLNDLKEAERKNTESVKIIADRYNSNVEKLYEIFTKNLSIMDYIRLFSGTFMILDFFKELIKIDNEDHFVSNIEKNEM